MILDSQLIIYWFDLEHDSINLSIALICTTLMACVWKYIAVNKAKAHNRGSVELGFLCMCYKEKNPKWNGEIANAWWMTQMNLILVDDAYDDTVLIASICTNWRLLKHLTKSKWRKIMHMRHGFVDAQLAANNISYTRAHISPTHIWQPCL